MNKEQIEAAIKQFKEDWPQAEWGGAHIVLSDYNLDDGYIDFCLGEMDRCDHSPDEVEAVRQFLVWLKSTPAEVREYWHEDDC